ncbi:MAG: hypothetical protein K2O80_06205 [Helicobacter apodemus]|nr:hypothetical protein [Helicobacter apodemus]
MENYENLRLEEKDKIKKMNVFQRIFTKDSQISSEDLEFLEEYENHSKNIKDAQEKSEIDTLYLQQQNANISLKIEEKEEI